MNQSHTNGSPVEYKVDVKFLSDWHIGSGLERPGSVDRLVQRDAAGFPFVPAKTLTGMFRDAAEEIALRLGGGLANEPWYRWVLWLFGDQPTRGETLGWRQLHDSQVSIRPAVLPSELRIALAGADPRRRELREALFVHKPGVKIGRHGQAENKHLRLDEMVRGGITLNTTLTIQFKGLHPDQQETANNLLLLAAEFVERMGGKRRRGAGRVKLTLSGGGLPEKNVGTLLADYLQNHELPAALPNEPPRPVSPSVRGKTAPTAKGDWWILPFRLELLSPLLVPERTIGNVVKSLDFVPGTYMLPIVTRAMQAQLPDVRERIMAGDIRVSPATVVIEDGRSLPVPAALFHPKGNEKWLEHSGEVSNRFCEPNKNAEHIKDFREGYILPQPCVHKLPAYAQSHKVVRPHNTVDEQSQRPTSEVGGVFSYEAIAAGIVLAGEIRVRDSVKQQLEHSTGSEVFSLLSGEHSLGRSKKDDYGRVKLVLQQETWEKLETTKVVQAVEELTIWFTSDVLLTDASLQPATNVNGLVAEIATAVGLRPDDIVGEPQAFLRYRRIESWHVAWGLPRTSLVSIAAGSCVKLKFKTPISVEAMKRLESEGIGRRKAEGYGMLQVQPQLLTNAIANWEAAESKRSKPALEAPSIITDRGGFKELARVLEKECWRRRIRREVLERTMRAKDRLLRFDGDKPNAAQAALLRNLLRANFSDQDMIGRLERLQEMRGKLWPEGCLDRIRTLFAEANNIWLTLEADSWPVLTEDGRKTLKDELHREAIKSLIDAAVRAYQRHRESRRSSRSPSPAAEIRS